MRFLERRRRRIFVYGQAVDMRKGFGGLEAIIRNQLGEDPLSGDLFVFLNRRGHLLKAFLWDRTGYVIITKRLERGKFRLRNSGEKLYLDEQRLALLFDGVKTGALKAPPRELETTNCSVQNLGPAKNGAAPSENAPASVWG